MNMETDEIKKSTNTRSFFFFENIYRDLFLWTQKKEEEEEEDIVKDLFIIVN